MHKLTFIALEILANNDHRYICRIYKLVLNQFTTRILATDISLNSNAKCRAYRAPGSTGTKVKDAGLNTLYLSWKMRRNTATF
jgi:hypothetical protein